MRRVVITGMGIVSSIGNNTQEVLASLHEAKSGITRAEKYAELGFRCHVHAPPQIDWESMVDRRAARFLAQGTAFGHLAMEQAIADAGLEEAEVFHERTKNIRRHVAGTIKSRHQRGWNDEHVLSR